MQKLIEGIHQFQRENFLPLQGLFEKLAKGQTPQNFSYPAEYSERTGMSFQARQGFWQEASALRESITHKVMPFVLVFGPLRDERRPEQRRLSTNRMRRHD